MEIEDKSKYVTPALLLLVSFFVLTFFLKMIQSPQQEEVIPTDYNFEYTLNDRIHYSNQCFTSEHDIKYCLNEENGRLFVVDDYIKK